MANIQDYLRWRGDLSFSTAPVNELDRYIIACLGKPDYSGLLPEDGSTVRLGEALDAFFTAYPQAERLGLVGSVYTLPMLRQLRDAPRFRDLRLGGFVNRVSAQETKQFSALTVPAPDGVTYVTFRGTDDSLVGWRENCELTVSPWVPAQKDALDYLDWAASVYAGPLVVCGHSKGGNLAVYAACGVSRLVQARIRAVYSYDGPGFREDFFAGPGYLRMRDRITTLVPSRSVVGMLLEPAGRLDVVQSEVSGIRGHDGLTWEAGREGFVRPAALSHASLVFRDAMAEVLEDMDVQAREELIQEIFAVLGSTGAFMLTDFTEGSLRQAAEMAGQLRRAPELRRFLRSLAENSLRQTKGRLGNRRK